MMKGKTSLDHSLNFCIDGFWVNAKFQKFEQQCAMKFEFIWGTHETLSLKVIHEVSHRQVKIFMAFQPEKKPGV